MSTSLTVCLAIGAVFTLWLVCMINANLVWCLWFLRVFGCLLGLIVGVVFAIVLWKLTQNLHESLTKDVIAAKSKGVSP